MRPYRGKPVAGGDFVYGWYVKVSDGYFIVNEQASHFQWPAIWNPIEVIPDSVGQSTGKFDKGNKETFEGDILIDNNEWDDRTFRETGDIFVVKWNVEYAEFNCINKTNTIDGDITMEGVPELEIIGNTTDNPELMKEQK